MIRHRTYCSTHKAFHCFDSPDSTNPTQHATCAEGKPPKDFDLSHGAGRRTLTVGSPHFGFDGHSITVFVAEPGVLLFESAVGTEDFCHEFDHPIHLADFLTKLGLHQEAAAGELLAFIQDHADNSECSCLDWMTTPKDGKCKHCVAVDLIVKATTGTTS